MHERNMAAIIVGFLATTIRLSYTYIPSSFSDWCLRRVDVSMHYHDISLGELDLDLMMFAEVDFKNERG